MVIPLLAFTGALVLWGGLIYLTVKSANKGTLLGVSVVLVGAAMIAGGTLFGFNVVNPVIADNTHKVTEHYGISNVRRVGEGELTALHSIDQEIPVTFVDDTDSETLGVLHVQDGQASLMVTVDGDFTEYGTR